MPGPADSKDLEDLPFQNGRGGCKRRFSSDFVTKAKLYISRGAHCNVKKKTTNSRGMDKRRPPLSHPKGTINICLAPFPRIPYGPVGPGPHGAIENPSKVPERQIGKTRREFFSTFSDTENDPAGLAAILAAGPTQHQ